MMHVKRWKEASSVNAVSLFCGRLFLLLLPLALAVSPAYGGNSGTTFAGSSGLFTVPVPDFSATGRGLAFKSNSFDGRLNYQNQTIDTGKDEQLISIRNKFSSEIEMSLVNVNFRRRGLAALSGSANLYGIGVKVSPDEGDRDFCYGFNVAPLTNRESLLSDIEQIESLRNLYATFHEKMSRRIDGYLSLSVAYAGSQKIEFADGSRREKDRNEIYTGTLGASMQIGHGAMFICEFKTGHYRDLLSDDTVRYRLHSGLRLNLSRGTIEAVVYDLTNADMTIGFGGGVNF
ncbi:MAG TPA: hypothetical protein PLM07_06485 [Candidatus Rifleibacterium sp.]|nr:hypothetical protein [Candidatus Rifleibacterium sp.]